MNHEKQLLLLKTVLIHAACWILFIAYELYYLYYVSGRFESFLAYASFYSVNILLFYCHLSLLIFVFNRSKPQYFVGCIYFVALIFGIVFLKFIIGYLMQLPGLSVKKFLGFYLKQLPATIWRTCYFMVLSTFFWAAGHISYFRRQSAAAERHQLITLKENAEIQARLAESRNAYLAQQINPHMLFNALNFIYASVYQQSPEAASCVLNVSEIMQFSLEETGEDGKINLAGEIKQLENLIAVNKYRFERGMALEAVFEGPFEKFRFIPLILFTLTENIFKHGRLNDFTAPATLHISVDEDGNLRYLSRNTIKSKSSHSRRHEPKGMQNVKVRLDFAYPSLYDLTVFETPDCYELSLNLKL